MKPIRYTLTEKEIGCLGRRFLVIFTSISALLLVINLCHVPLSEAITVPIAIFITGILFHIISSLGTGVATPVYTFFIFIASIIAILIANLLLTLFYYLLFSLIAMLFKITKTRDPLMLNRNINRKSWWLKKV